MGYTVSESTLAQPKYIPVSRTLPTDCETSSGRLAVGIPKSLLPLPNPLETRPFSSIGYGLEGMSPPTIFGLSVAMTNIDPLRGLCIPYIGPPIAFTCHSDAGLLYYAGCKYLVHARSAQLVQFDKLPGQFSLGIQYEFGNDSSDVFSTQQPTCFFQFDKPWLDKCTFDAFLPLPHYLILESKSAQMYQLRQAELRQK